MSDWHGTIWREKDRRFERYVKIIGDAPLDRYAVQTCTVDGISLHSRVTYAKREAFGRRYQQVPS